MPIAIRTATIAYTGCHTRNRVAGNSHSGWTADTRIHIDMTAGMRRIRMTAGMRRIRIHNSRSIRADTRADALCGSRPQRSLQ